MRYLIDVEIIDLLESRPNPLRRSLALVSYMHTDQTDFHLALQFRLSVGPDP